MDRSKWEYKKLGEVCSKLTDGSHNPPKGIEDSDFRMISSQNIFNDKIDLSDYRCLSKEDFEIENRRTALKKGDLLLTIVGAIGRCYVLNGTEGNLTLQRSVAAITPKDNVSSRFLMYYFISNNANLLEEAHGVAQKGIYLRQLANLIVPIPSLEKQQRIVAELDCLNEMIALKQEQLKEFDKLAQSIFYDMFFNDSKDSFEKIELKECVKEMHLGPFGSALKNEYFVPKESAYCMVYEQQHAIKKTMNLPTRYVNEEKYRELERFEVGPGDLLMSCRGTIGEVFVIPNEAPMGIIHPSLMKIRLNPACIDRTYFLYLLTHIIKEKDSNGATIKMAITAKELGKEPIPLPPLALQQEFAEKIQAIEAQKELVKKSIAETQALLDYTMDKYFG